MSKKFVNTVHLEGYLYEHNLTLKTSGPQSKNPGTEYITGTISIATDEKLENIVKVEYAYATEMTSSGKENKSYEILAGILNGTYPTVMAAGKDNAMKISVDSAIALKEFYSDRSGKEEFISIMNNQGGFINIVTMLNEDEKKRNNFKVDMLINKAILTPETDEGPEPRQEHLTLKGAIFDFRGALLPVEFKVYDGEAINYFSGLDANERNPIFTKVGGAEIAQTVIKTYVEESAFGEDEVREVKSSRREFVVNWSAREPYEWDSEETITVNEIKEKVAAREIDKAAMLKRFKDNKDRTKPAANGFGSINKGDFSDF